MKPRSLIVHASCVALAGKAVLITGPSGSGKSALALELIALGADLVADDRTTLERQGDEVLASAPAALSGLIEARGVGIIALDCQCAVPVALVVDLLQRETARLPERHTRRLLDREVPCLHKVDAGYFSAAVHAYLKGRIYAP
jgi:HPr kinase/phosphorylase